MAERVTLPQTTREIYARFIVHDRRRSCLKLLIASHLTIANGIRRKKYSAGSSSVSSLHFSASDYSVEITCASRQLDFSRVFYGEVSKLTWESGGERQLSLPTVKRQRTRVNKGRFIARRGTRRQGTLCEADSKTLRRLKRRR